MRSWRWQKLAMLKQLHGFFWTSPPAGSMVRNIEAQQRVLSRDWPIGAVTSAPKSQTYSKDGLQLRFPRHLPTRWWRRLKMMRRRSIPVSNQTVMPEVLPNRMPTFIAWFGTSGGISFLPGGQYPLLEALICVRLARKEPERLIETLFDSLSRMDDPKIWQALLNIFVYLQPGEHDRRAEFLTTVFDRFPELIGTTEAARLLAQVHWWAPDMVRRQLERWRRVSDAHVLQAYGELVALVAIQQPDVPWPHALLEEIEGVENSGSRTSRRSLFRGQRLDRTEIPRDRDWFNK